jgi:hypothetical protein
LADVFDDVLDVGCAGCGLADVELPAAAGALLDGGWLLGWVCASAGTANRATQTPTPISQDAVLTMNSSGKAANVRGHYTYQTSQISKPIPRVALFFRATFL